MYYCARGVFAFVSLTWVSSAFAESYSINAPEYALAQSSSGGASGFVTGAAFTGGAARVNASLPIFGQTRSIPLTLKAASGAAQAIGRFARFAGPAGVGLAIAGWLVEKGIEAREGVWVNPNVQYSTNTPGCWTIGVTCVSDPAAYVNNAMEQVNASMPRLYGDWPGGYSRSKVGPVKSSTNADIYTEYIEYQILTKDCNVFHDPSCGEYYHQYSVTASRTSPPPTPYYSPAPESAFGGISGDVPDNVLNEASRLGVPIPVEAPQVDISITGVPYTPTGSTSNVIPSARITAGAPGYLNVDYQNLPIVAGTDTTTTGTTTGTTTTTTTTGTTTNNTTTNNVTNNTTTNNTTINNTTTTNNYEQAAAEELDIPDLCKDNPNSLACQEMGEAEDEEVTKENKEFSYTPFNLGLPSGCPAPRLVSGDVYLEYPCDAAKTARPIVVALGAVAALMIMFAAVRS